MLSQLGMYFDVDRPHLEVPSQPGSWAAMSPVEWDRLFAASAHLPPEHLPNSGAPAAQGRGVYAHDFLVFPVSGGSNYMRRWGGGGGRAAAEYGSAGAHAC